MKRRDLSGQVYGRLTVISMAPTPTGKHSRWKCRCECGNEVVVRSNNLRLQRSCGCIGREKASERLRSHGATRSGKKADGYHIWSHMIRQCHVAANPSYDGYGGRGVTVCDRWRYGEAGKHGFQCFMSDMGPRPSAKHSIDRINNDGNYEPENCRWATASQQTRNRRSNRLVVYRGRQMPLVDACEVAGLNYNTVSARLGHGWSTERALSEAAR